MEKLSVVIITFNEEKNIERCLSSVKTVADEIVVVDSYSTDRTREICTSHGVVFIERAFAGHIEQKNFALAQVSNHYALSLDADEALSETLAAAILTEKSKGFPAGGYEMNRLNRYCGKWIRHGNYYPDRKLRLVKKETAYWGGTNPHDKLILRESPALRKLKGDILHLAYDTYEEHMEKTNRYSTIAAEQKFRQGKTAGFLSLLVRPAWAFFRSYVLRLGFVDGSEGLAIAKFIAFENFLKYAKLRKLWKDKAASP